MKQSLRNLLVVATLGIPLALGCQDTMDDFDSAEVESALEKENGGYDMENEKKEFGTEQLFTAAEEGEEESEVSDAIEDTDEVREMRDRPDAALFHTTIMWGQFPSNFELETPRTWDGTLSVNRGAIVVRSVIRFEGESDELIPRDDRKVVAFRSTTLPHRDGLRVTIIDPTPQSDEPLTLSYTDRDGNVVLSTAVRNLVEARKSVVVDDLNNRIVALSIPEPGDLCQSGFIGGKWHKITERFGIFVGKVKNSRGVTAGHMRGIYGQRLNGNKVFFGKYINLEGEFKGIFRGTYSEGHFSGKWINRNGEVGVLGGQYRQSDRVSGLGGHYLGRWMETSCNLPIDVSRDRPEADAE